MNPDQQNFEALRRLLALKRHEQPPPGYFHHFSREVIHRIRAGERAADPALESWLLPLWLRRFWNALETKPSLAGALGAGLCSLMLWAVVSTESPAAGSAFMAIEPPVPGPFQVSRTTTQNPIDDGMLVRFSSTNSFSVGQASWYESVWPKGSFANSPNR